MIRNVLALLAVCLLVRSVAALPAGMEKKIDEVFAEWSGTHTPGCAIGISRDERLVFTRGYGMADLERGVAISPRSVFGIQSTSKQFVAMAIALLVRDGKLSFGDSVRKFVPELPDYGETITVRHLLDHSSGLRDVAILTQDQGWRGDEPLPDRYILALIARQKSLNHRPGAAASYTNSGYFLLQMIIERITGRPLEAFAQERIFGPLGMTRSRFRSDADQVMEGRVAGYQRRADGAWYHARSFKDNVFTTVEDLARWSANFAEPVVGDEEIIRWMTTWGTLSSGHRTEWGLGLSPLRHRGLDGYYFSGGGRDGTSVFVRFPEQKFAMSILCNGSITFNAEHLAPKVIDAVLAAEIADAEKTAAPQPPVANPAPANVPADELARAAGLYFSTQGGPWRRELRIEDGRPRLVVSPELTVNLIPLGHGRFRVEGASTEYIVRDGSMTRVPPDAPPAVLERVDPAKPAKLEEFAGTWWNDEVEAAIVFSVVNGKLAYAMPRQDGEPTPLEPIFRDAFEDGALVFRFHRDARGRITSVSKHWDRVWDLRYVRRGPPAPLTAARR